MKKRLLSMLLVLVLCVGVASQVKVSAAAAELSQEQVYQAMIALKAQYPEGMSWTNDNYYAWKGGIYAGGHGCAGFAFALSDAAFGSLPARKMTQFAFSDVKVGDILRMNNDTHSVIVLEVYDDHVVIAEGNYNSSVHWGRSLTSAEVMTADSIMTRYPEGASAPAPAFTFTDVPNWCKKETSWAVDKGITKGYGGKNSFAPNIECPQVQILTFLWRAEDEPDAAAKAPVTVASYYQDAVNWAYEKGLIDDTFAPDTPCTRSQAVQYIWQARGKLEAKTTASFSDVKANAPYAKAVSWAVEKKVTNGYGGNENFAPDRVCTRGEIAVFLYRAYNN